MLFKCRKSEQFKIFFFFNKCFGLGEVCQGRTCLAEGQFNLTCQIQFVEGDCAGQQFERLVAVFLCVVVRAEVVFGCREPVKCIGVIGVERYGLLEQHVGIAALAFIEERNGIGTNAFGLELVFFGSSLRKTQKWKGQNDK